MSLLEEPSQENDQKGSEVRLQEDNKTNESEEPRNLNPEDQKDKDMRTKDLLKTSQRDRRTINPLTLFKEDFSQFKEGVFKVLKDKDMKTECVDGPSSLTENKTASSTLSLLKEDFSQLKEGVTSVFSISSSKDKKTITVHEDCSSSQAENKLVSSTLGLLKEDLNQFKEDITSVFAISSSKDKETNTECEDCSLDQAENTLVSSTFVLLKEDLSQFKEDMTSVFSISSSKDKKTKTECEDHPSNQAENKLVSSTLGLLKEDLSQFKEDMTSVFSISSSKDKETKSAERTINRRSFFKDDFNPFKEVFRIGLSKERDAAKEDSSDTFKIKVLKAERTEEPFKSLFRRDQKSFQRAENSQAVKKTFSETREEQMDGGLRGNLSEQKEETVDAEKTNNNNMKDGMDELEVSEVDIPASEEKTESPSETQLNEELILTSQAGEQRRESEECSDDSSVVSAEDEKINEEGEEEKEEKQSETLPWVSLSSGISLFSLRDPKKDNARDQPGGDLWSVKNFACYLTFDPNTANSELCLTDCNRKATRVWSDHQPSDHPDRFKRCPQVLCREGLLDSVYWEVMWSSGADIGVTYNSICRDGDTASCLLGHNKWSWSLECSEGSYTPCHDNKRFRSCSPRPFSHRVGVYLDFSAGSLSFYCVSQDTMVHLHTFTSTFTEPLYPGFWVWSYDGSVSLCQVELDWERLLQ